LSQLNPSETITCPGLFYATPAKDGQLFRLRIPSGILTNKQCLIIAELGEELGHGWLQVTNRSNLQFRTKIGIINPDLLQKLQEFGLAAKNRTIDHLRNIMASPTAGIDRAQLIDTRLLVAKFAAYIENNPYLSSLPPKFSVGFAGGERVTIVNQLNEFLFAAEEIENRVYFRLILNAGKEKDSIDTGILLASRQCLPMMTTSIAVYLEAINDPTLKKLSKRQKPRLRDILNHLGIDWYLDRVLSRLSFVPNCLEFDKKLSANKKTIVENGAIGIYPQLQAELFYLGVNLPLGNLEARQLRELAKLLEIYGDGELRLTPWQSLLISNVPTDKIDDLRAEITNMGLNCAIDRPYNGLVACAGNTGCAKSATDTQKHALALAKYLEGKTSPDKPALNIHFTGCPKSCAQANQADITFLGTTIQQDDRILEVYQIYAKGGEDSKFGRLVAENVCFEESAIGSQIIDENLKKVSNIF
jgi:ferredoxin-nitrite reductase